MQGNSYKPTAIMQYVNPR